MFGILIALNWAFFIPNQNTIVMLFVLSHSVDESFDFFPLFVFVFYYWWNLIGQDVSVFYSMLLLKMPKKKFEEISVKCSQFMHESFSKKKIILNDFQFLFVIENLHDCLTYFMVIRFWKIFHLLTIVKSMQVGFREYLKQVFHNIFATLDLTDIDFS